LPHPCGTHGNGRQKKVSTANCNWALLAEQFSKPGGSFLDMMDHEGICSSSGSSIFYYFMQGHKCSSTYLL